MLKSHEYQIATIENIYNEIIALSSSVGQCINAIDLAHTAIDRLNNDFKEGHKDILKKLSYLESKEMERQGRYKFFHGLLQLSLPNIIKWAAAILMVAVFFTAKANFNAKDLARHFYEVVMQ